MFDVVSAVPNLLNWMSSLHGTLSNFLSPDSVLVIVEPGWWVSREVEIFLGPIVAFLAFVSASAAAYLLRQQIKHTERLGRIRHLVDLAVYKERSLRQQIEKRDTPMHGDLVKKKLFEKHATSSKDYYWVYNFEVRAVQTFHKSAPQTVVTTYPFSSAIAIVEDLLATFGSEQVKALYAQTKRDGGFFRIDLELEAFIGDWRNLLLLTEEAIGLGFGNKEAGTLLETTFRYAEILKAIGAIEAAEFLKAKRILARATS